MSIGDSVGYAFDTLCFLSFNLNVVEINLAICSHEEIEVVAKYKRETQNFLCFWESQLSLFGLLFFYV